MPRSRSPELEEKRKQEVVSTVYRLLSQGSFHEMTLAGVAKEAGVSKGLVTYYFPSKDELIVETIRRYHEQQQLALLAIVAEPVPVALRLERLIEAAFPSHESVKEELRFQIEAWSFAKSRPRVWEAIADSYRGFRAACQAMLDLGAEEGYVTAENRALLYLFIHALVDGLSFQVTVDPNLDLKKVREQMRHVLERLLRP